MNVRTVAANLLRDVADGLQPTRVHVWRSGARPTRTTCVDEHRQEAALGLLDDEVVGFVLVQVRRDGAGEKVDLDMALDERHQVAVNATLSRLILQTERA